MPYRIDPIQFPFRAKIQFTTSAEMPNLIYRACQATGTVSGTVYLQHAVCAALARDLGLNEQDLLDRLPAPRGPAKHLYDPANPRKRVGKDNTGGTLVIGPANTNEEVR